MNGELCTDDQPLVSGEKPGKASHVASKSTQTFKIDIFTEEVTCCSQSLLVLDFTDSVLFNLLNLVSG